MHLEREKWQWSCLSNLTMCFWLNIFLNTPVFFQTVAPLQPSGFYGKIPQTLFAVVYRMCSLPNKGLFWELNPGPLAPEARIMPLDQTAKWLQRRTIASHLQARGLMLWIYRHMQVFFCFKINSWVNRGQVYTRSPVWTWKGPARIWTAIAGFRVQSANRYTTGPADLCGGP